MFRCTRCGQTYRDFHYTCDRCNGILLVDYEKRSWSPTRGCEGTWRYQSMIPVVKSISLSEGNTPLVRRRDVKDETYLKVEGDNPTGSFKDRGSTVTISDAFNRHFTRTTTASTGNMGASVAAYSAYANLETRVFIPHGIPREKVAQIEAYNAELVDVEGGFIEAVRRAREEADLHGAYLASTGLNPYFIEGLKTVAFEIFEQLKGVPDKVVVPTGTGGILTSIFKGFEELKGLGLVSELPKMIAVQSKEVSPIVTAWDTGSEIVPPPPEASTIASAILVKTPFNGNTAIDALKRSGGQGVTVTDEQILKAIRTLGHEGVFAEPAAAASLAALDEIDHQKDERIVLMVTGSGLKDPTAILQRTKSSSAPL